MEIETERLLLRQFQEADFAVYAAMLADPDVARFIGGVRDQAGARHHFESACAHWRDRGFGKFAIEEKASGHLIGRAGPTIHADAPDVELGWTMAKTSWGRGYATEAAWACAAWMFETLSLKEIVSFIDPANVASVRVAEKLGQSYARDIVFEAESLRVYAVTLDGFTGVNAP
ncbi:MAG: GNAT family N-acetyltransferase [Candidatus Phaeomarinobacter sp.]